MREPMKRLARRVANSYKVQTALYRLGLRDRPYGVRDVADPALYHHWQEAVPPRHLWVGPEDPLNHFLRWPLEYRAYLPLLCGPPPPISLDTGLG